MPEWKISLKGNKEGLDSISKLFFPDFNVINEKGDYYLKSVKLNKIIDPQQVIDSATSMVDTLNGAATLLYRHFESINIGILSHIETNNPPTQFIFPAGIPTSESIGEPGVVSTEDPEGLEYSSVLERWIKIASGNENIRIALQLYGSLEPNWKNLYLIRDIIIDDVGNQTALENKRWVLKSKLKLFKRTANSFLAIGNDARHSTSKHDPPAKPMDINEAQTLIRDLLDKWIKSKY